jgi:acyl dehydratase
MFTMATGGRFVSDWAQDPGAIVSYGVRFTSMVVVPDDDQGATLEVTGQITAKDDAARTATVLLTATSAGQKVLGKATAVVRLP